MMISVRKYHVVVLCNTNPVSRHLQCGMTLYSKYKNETRIRDWDKWRGIYVVVVIIIITIIIIIIIIIKPN